MRRLDYAPQLDGLRGVAVLAVLLFHGAVGWSIGGFLGVDLFFVVSGYLITTLLLREAVDTGGVAFGDFYGRRARRLLPALVAVVAAVVAFGALFSSAGEAAVIRRDALGALLYVENWVQVVADAGYFATFDAPSPLRHVWSLAIEEQWYLVWPVVVLGCRRFAPDPRRAVAVVSGALFAASAAWMVALEGMGASIDRLYYGTDTRLQAVAIGGLLATTGVRAGSQRWDRWAPLVAASSLAGVLAMFALVDGGDRWLYRGGFTLFAVLGAVLVAATARPGPLTTALSWTGLVVVGRISYSLYLWHWPIFLAINPSNTGLDGSALLVVRFILSFAAATVSYQLVERPIRRRSVTPRLAWGLVGSTLALALVAGLTITREDPALAVADPEALAPSADAEPSKVEPLSGERERVLVIGDSIAHTFSYFIDLDPLGAEFDPVNGGRIGCGLVEAAGTLGTGFEDGTEGCLDRFAVWDRMMDEHEPSTVLVMIGGWEIFDRIVDGEIYEVGTPIWEALMNDRLDTVVASARGHDAKILLATVPCFDAPDRGLPGDTAAVRNDPRRVDALNEVLRDRAAAEPDVSLVDVATVVCPDGEAVGSIDGVPVRIDGIHYSPEGATEVWRAIIDDVNAAVGSV